jgi:Fe-S cluster assembly iron-binding protein IscA
MACTNRPKKGDTMLTVTKRAKTYLKESVLPRIETPGVSARLGQTAPGQLSLFQDTGKEGDQVVEYQGATVLLIDPGLSGRFAGALIDCVESSRGRELTIRRSKTG